MLTVALIVKLIAEVAWLALLGQCLLGLLITRSRRQHNFFYQILRSAGAPFVALTRWGCPACVADRVVPLVAMLMLALLWASATILKVYICLQMGMHLCK